MQPTAKAAYKAWEVAELLGFSVPTVRKLFEREPGVLIVASVGKRYRSMRIPAEVLERVRRRLSVR